MSVKGFWRAVAPAWGFLLYGALCGFLIGYGVAR